MNASSTTQHCVTFSTSEAEYAAMAQGANTALFTKAVLDFLQPELASDTIDLFQDNQRTIAIAENTISGGRTKHLVHESSNQLADILTKPLRLEAFTRHRSFLMNLSE